LIGAPPGHPVRSASAPNPAQGEARRHLHFAAMLQRLDLKPRARAAGIHLLLSLAIALLAAVLVFGLWYPGDFRLLAGGRDLFILVMSVDVIIGPVLTFAVFNRAKGSRHLRRDLAVIGLLQTAALAYGLHTVYIVRPVAMVYEVDRFRLINADAVQVAELQEAPPSYRSLPLTGPWLLGARKPDAGAEHNDALFSGAAGVDVSQRPRFWQPYDEAKPRALARSRPLAALISHYQTRAPDLRRRLAEMHADEASARFLPALARGEWVAVMNAGGDVLGYLPVDGFF